MAASPLSTTAPETAREPWREPRWPIVLAVATVILLIETMSGRIALFPEWMRWALGIAVVVPAVLVAAGRKPERWLVLERRVTFAFCLVATLGTVANLSNLLNSMMNSQQQPVTGKQLLASSI